MQKHRHTHKSQTGFRLIVALSVVSLERIHIYLNITIVISLSLFLSLSLSVYLSIYVSQKVLHFVSVSCYQNSAGYQISLRAATNEDQYGACLCSRNCSGAKRGYISSHDFMMFHFHSKCVCGNFSFFPPSEPDHISD